MLRDLIRKLRGRKLAPLAEGPGEPVHPPADSEDNRWMFPPTSLEDPSAWDQYWKDQLTHGAAGFVHLFVDDGELVDVMRKHGLSTVLCAGNGISQEPRALAWAGFDVTALDISPLAATVADGLIPPDEFLSGLVGGRAGGREGRLDFVVGDIRDRTCCPGPYDVVIDRRTLQLWPDENQSVAIRAVADRLASRGIFFSQSHDAGWSPPAPLRHALKPWFVEQGWQIWEEGGSLTGRVAWLEITTG